MPHTNRLFYMIILLTAMSHVTADLYLPSFYAIMQELNTDDSFVQMSMSLFMFGFAISQLIYGPLSDALGRRPPLIAGLILCLTGSLICCYASSIEMLNIGRFVQGLGVGSATVLGRAIMRDCFSGNRLIRYFSYLGSTVIIVMASAPLVGGYIQQFFDWRMNFAFLAFYTMLVLIGTYFLIPETHKNPSVEYIKISHFINSAKTILLNKEFIGYTCCLALAYAGFLIWLSAGTILLEKGMRIGPIGVGWLIFTEGVFYAIGAWINIRVVEN